MIEIRNYYLTDIKIMNGIIPGQLPVSTYQYTTVIAELKDKKERSERFIIKFNIPITYFYTHCDPTNLYIDYLRENFDNIIRINKIKSFLK